MSKNQEANYHAEQVMKKQAQDDIERAAIFGTTPEEERRYRALTEALTKHKHAIVFSDEYRAEVERTRLTYEARYRQSLLLAITYNTITWAFLGGILYRIHRYASSYGR